MAAHFPFQNADNDPFHSSESGQLDAEDTTGTESRPFLPTRLRNSIKRKLSQFSPFNRRPNSCHFDFRFSSCEAQSLCVSSHSLLFPMAFPNSSYPVPTPVAHPGGPLQHQLHPEASSSFPQQCISAGHGKKPKLTSVLKESLRSGGRFLKRSSSISSKSLQEDSSKGREITTYFKKIASKRKDKLSSSVSSLSVKMRERNFLKRGSQHPPLQGRRSVHEDFLFHKSGLMAADDAIQQEEYRCSRPRSNTVSGVNESAASFRRNYAFRSKRTSQELSHHANPVLFPPKEADEIISEDKSTLPKDRSVSPQHPLDASISQDLLANHTSLEKIRFIDSSSEEEFEADLPLVSLSPQSFTTRDAKFRHSDRNSEALPGHKTRNVDSSNDRYAKSSLETLKKTLSLTNLLLDHLNHSRNPQPSETPPVASNVQREDQNHKPSTPFTSKCNGGARPKTHPFSEGFGHVECPPSSKKKATSNSSGGTEGEQLRLHTSNQLKATDVNDSHEICYASEEFVIFEEALSILDDESLSQRRPEDTTFDITDEIDHFDESTLVTSIEVEDSLAEVMPDGNLAKAVQESSIIDQGSIASGELNDGPPAENSPCLCPSARRYSSKSLTDLTRGSFSKEGAIAGATERATHLASGYGIQRRPLMNAVSNSSSLKRCHSLGGLVCIPLAPLGGKDLLLRTVSTANKGQDETETRDDLSSHLAIHTVHQDPGCCYPSEAEPSPISPLRAAEVPCDSLDAPIHSTAKPRSHKRRRRKDKRGNSANKSDQSSQDPPQVAARSSEVVAGGKSAKGGRRVRRRRRRGAKLSKVKENKLIKKDGPQIGYQRTPKLRRKKVSRSASAACKLFSLSGREETWENEEDEEETTPPAMSPRETFLHMRKASNGIVNPILDIREEQNNLLKDVHDGLTQLDARSHGPVDAKADTEVVHPPAVGLNDDKYLHWGLLGGQNRGGYSSSREGDCLPNFNENKRENYDSSSQDLKSELSELINPKGSSKVFKENEISNYHKFVLECAKNEILQQNNISQLRFDPSSILNIEQMANSCQNIERQHDRILLYPFSSPFEAQKEEDEENDATNFVRFLYLEETDDSLGKCVRWALTEGEEELSGFQNSANTLSGINRQVSEFGNFFCSAQEQVEKGLDLLNHEERQIRDEDLSLRGKESSAKDEGQEDESTSQDLTKVLSRHLAAFADKLNLTKDRLEDTAKCYLLLDKAYEWALEAMKVVDQVKSSGVASPEQVGTAAKAIGNYLQENPPLSDDAFTAMLTLATRLNNQTLLQQCKVAQSRCQETVDLLKSRHSTLLKASRQMEFDCQSYVDLNEVLSGTDDSSPLTWLSNSTLNNSGRRKSVSSIGSRHRDPLSRCSSLETEDDSSFSEPQSSSTPLKPSLESRVSLGDIKELRESAEDLQVSYPIQRKRSVGLNNSSPHTIYASSILAFSSGSSSCSSSDSSGPITHKTNSHNWRFSEISSESAEDNQNILDESLLSHLSIKSAPPTSANSHLLIRGSQINLSNSEDLTQEEVKKSKTLLLIMQELIQTERDYVNSLEYIIENYIPELLREDIPQALRGQRNVIFGNLEKIYEFHSGYFLLALEACQSRPFSVGSIFLKYESQFYLYALYNKNKPKSDSLMSEYGSAFFKKMQLELGDKMDLSSYLLKPVQRMGKYALLLKQLLKDCARSEEGYEDLQLAQEMVQFQLRHGNDLLAMDSLRDCDVNLKEQGRLMRQGEFLVTEGSRKKSFRHVFLFEDLILFSKARKDPEKKTLDIFQYKHSIKMTDIGLTEQMGESSNKFEIWFRKRKPSDTYILQANNPEVKESWTEEISKVLWRQALRNRTLRLHEMSSMGIGNKPCLDIRPSEDQINDRSVYIGRPPRLRPCLSPPPESLMGCQRPQSVISISSSSSSGGSSSHASSTGPTFTGNLNLGFEPGDSPRSLTRSVTRTSQCSAESGILADIYPEKENDETHYKVERSNSSVTTASVDSALSPPCGNPPSGTPSSSSLSPSSPSAAAAPVDQTSLAISEAADQPQEEDLIHTKPTLTTEV